ncbi:MAG: hypothetical protein KKD64_10080 [Alphaproteobacteria bacterium]|nr:hypothetical protein [Alphaproteobacteria bacterium]MBU0793924.1 hypothetical protein [Alphaproteobacteria bacterium]MBU0875830.1 hypothetical protein [Alphaproteobacteria bacterium]MBU1769990.1 hypothetical protein [Alphaproteobacteria bacterium]
MSKRNIHRLVGACVAAATALAVTPVQARDHGRVTVVRGPSGGGYIAGRHVSRESGETQVTRGALTRSGHGYRQTRTTSAGDGTVSNQVERRYANGASMSRSGSVTRNDDGSVSASRSRTGPGGNSRSGWSTIYRTDDGYTAQRGASTSNGRGYSASRDVSVQDDQVTVNRNAVTNSGRSVSSTRTYPRGN